MISVYDIEEPLHPPFEPVVLADFTGDSPKCRMRIVATMQSPFLMHVRCDFKKQGELRILRDLKSSYWAREADFIRLVVCEDAPLGFWPLEYQLEMVAERLACVAEDSISPSEVIPLHLRNASGYRIISPYRPGTGPSVEN